MFYQIRSLPELPVIYYLKIGKKGETVITRNKKKMRKPEKADKISLVHPIRDGEENYVFVEGFEPTNKVPITFPMSTPDDVFRAFRGKYNKTQNFYECRGNGRTCLKAPEGTEGSYIRGTCPCSEAFGTKCKLNGTLYAQVEGYNGALDCSRFRTTSWYSIRNIDAALRYLFHFYGDLRKVEGAYLAVEYRVVMHDGTETAQPIVRIGIDAIIPDKTVSWKSLYDNFNYDFIEGDAEPDVDDEILVNELDDEDDEETSEEDIPEEDVVQETGEIASESDTVDEITDVKENLEEETPPEKLKGKALAQHRDAIDAEIYAMDEDEVDKVVSGEKTMEEVLAERENTEQAEISFDETTKKKTGKRKTK